MLMFMFLSKAVQYVHLGKSFADLAWRATHSGQVKEFYVSIFLFFGLTVDIIEKTIYKLNYFEIATDRNISPEFCKTKQNFATFKLPHLPQ